MAGLVCARPRQVLLIAVLLAAVSAVLSVQRLTFQSDRNALISDALAWNQRFKDWLNHFPGARDLLVVIDVKDPAGGPGEPIDPGRHSAVRRMISEMGPMLAARPTLEQVTWGFDPRGVSPRLIRLLPMEVLEQRLSDMAAAAPLLASGSLSQLLGQLPDMMRQSAGTPDAPSARIVAQIQGLSRLLTVVADALATPAEQPLPDLQARLSPAEAVLDWQYLQSASGRLYFIRISPSEDTRLLNSVEPAVRDIRAVLDEIRSRYPGLDVGLTGIEVVEADETHAATVDSAWASVLAVVLITIMLMTAFHSVRGPLLAVSSLLVGVAWTFGVLTLTIGHLQVISVVFAVILLGLGIAFSIHLACAFESVRHRHDDTPAGFTAALQECFEVVGPGVITGAVTTAAAFITTVFTQFTGVGEMGFIAAVGIMLCLISQFAVFPAMLRLTKPGHRDVVRMDDRVIHLFEPRWLMPFCRYPRATLAAATIITIASAWLTAHSMRFDYDLLKLQSANAAGVRWSQRVMTDGGESIYFAVSLVSDLDEARRRAVSMRQLPAVAERLGGVGLLFPTNEHAKLAAMAAARKELGPVLDAAPAPSTGEDSELLNRLGSLRIALLAAMLVQMPQEIRTALAPVQAALDRAASTASQLTPQQQQQRARRLEDAFARFRDQTAQSIRRALDPGPLQLDDLPPVLLADARDTLGRLVLEIHPDPPAGVSPLDPSFLPSFVQQVEMIDPEVTGTITQIYRSGALIRDAYMQAGVWAFLLVAALVLLDFRSLHDALLSLVPVAIGFTVTFAIMRLIGMSVNPANIIVLPLMFGIGVDCGVHVIHRYRQHPEETPPGLTRGTGKGITITTLTTVIGFATLMLASHRGIQSLGFVLSVGIALTLLACWAVLPAWLTLHRHWKNSGATSRGASP